MIDENPTQDKLIVVKLEARESIEMVDILSLSQDSKKKHLRKGIVRQHGNSRRSILQPVLEGEGFKPPNILWRTIQNRRLLIITHGVLMIEIPVKMDMHVLKEVPAIEVHMNSRAQ